MTHSIVQILQAAPASAPSPQGGMLMQFGPLILIFGVFYFLLIRPQAKKAKVHQAMLASLKAGDDVVTTGGILGKVTGIKDDRVTVQVQDGVRLQILRSHIQMVQGAATPARIEAKTEAKV